MKNPTITQSSQFKHIGYFVLMFLLLCGSIAFASDKEGVKENDMTTDGLKVMKSTRFTEAQINTDIDWSKYTKYQITPVEVTFRKNWKRNYNSSSRGVSGQVTDKDMTRIREGIAKIVYEAFDSALQKKGGLTKVDEADADTLLFKPRIINLDVYAPDVRNSSARSNSYIRQAGRATLFLEVYDDVSGEILARWVDTREDPDRGYFEWANQITNAARARIIVDGWARRLVEGLDELRASK